MPFLFHRISFPIKKIARIIKSGTKIYAAMEKIMIAAIIKKKILRMPIPSLSKSQITKMANNSDKRENIAIPF